MPGQSWNVAIIGGGASGVLTAAQLHRQQTAVTVALIDSTGTGRGLAYGTPHLCHLLNVPAGNMSAFPDQPEHFHYWLRQIDPWATRTTFAPRKVYGDYLNSVLEEACQGPNPVERITGTAVAVLKGREAGWEVRLEDGRVVEAKSVVLALGNLAPAVLSAAKGLQSSRYFNDPWASGAVDVAASPDSAVGRLTADGQVLLIGTGLTAIDVILALRAQGHTGPIHCISRRGLLPRAHAPCTPWTLPEDLFPSPVSRLPSPDSSSVSRLPSPVSSSGSMLKWLRLEIGRARQAGNNWRGVIDALRPHTARIWQSWSEQEKRRFLRHARAHWEVHRHRAAPQIASAIEAEIQAGTLLIHRGRIDAIEEHEEGLVVRWRWSASVAIRPPANPPTRLNDVPSLAAARVINCTGPDCDFSRLTQPLIVQMRGAGLIVPDRLRLGIETDESGRVLDKSGAVVEGLLAVGPLRKARFWESTAMPEIRVQAASVSTLVGVTAQSFRA